MPEAPGNRIKAWLEDPRNLKRLEGTARRMVHHEPRNRALVVDALYPVVRMAPDREELCQEVFQGLCETLLTQSDRLEALIDSGGGHPAAFIKTCYLNSLREGRRKRAGNMHTYLYNRLAHVLRQADGIRTDQVPPGKTLVYGLVEELVPVVKLYEPDLADIPFPYQAVGGLTYDAIKDAQTLTRLAETFWRGAVDLYGGQPMAIALNDLVAWIERNVTLGGQGPTEEPPEDGQGSSARGEGAMPAEGPPAIPAGDRQWLARLAGSCAARMSPRQRQAFYLRYGEERRFEEIAAAMGYGGPAGPKYAVVRAEEIVRDMLRVHPGLSPEDRDEEYFALFARELLAVLKNEL